MFEQQEYRAICGFQDNVIYLDNKIYIIEEGNSYKNKLRNMMCLDEQINQEYQIQINNQINEYIENQLKEECETFTPKHFNINILNEEQDQDEYDDEDKDQDETIINFIQTQPKYKKYSKNNQHYSNKKYSKNNQQIKNQPNKMKYKKQSNIQLEKNNKMKKNKTTNKIRQLGYTYKLNYIDDMIDKENDYDEENILLFNCYDYIDYDYYSDDSDDSDNYSCYSYYSF
jgi:hypothetical protein